MCWWTRPLAGRQTDLMDDTEKREIIAKVTDRLCARYPETSRYYIAGVVAEEYALLDTGRIRTYIPTLVEHSARNRLRGNAHPDRQSADTTHPRDQGR